MKAHERLGGPCGAVHEQAGQHVLARPVLAEEQHVDVRPADLSHEVRHALHAVRLADEPGTGLFPFRAEGLHPFLQPCRVGLQAAQLHGRMEGGQQLVVVVGFRHEVRGAGLDGLHGLVRVRVGCHHDDHRVRVELQDGLQALHAFLSAHGVAGEVHVEQDEVGPEVRHGVYEAFRRAHGFHFLGLRAEQEVQGEEHVLVVVDDENFS